MSDGIKFTITGTDAVVDMCQQLAKSKSKVQNIVKQQGSALQSRTRQNMASTYTHGYSTGETARTTELNIKDGGMTAEVAPTTNYFPYLEMGTRKMAAMPTLQPAFDVQSEMFIDKLKEVFNV